MKLLMHTCCAPCSVYCIDTLKKEGIEPTIYWYNPNIHPYMEYKARRDTLKEYAESLKLKAIFEEDYGLDEFCKNVVGDLQNRCKNYCYPVRLRKTFEYAKANGYDAVTTTLLYSIYQNHDFIKEYMEKLSEEFGIEFLFMLLPQLLVLLRQCSYCVVLCGSLQYHLSERITYRLCQYLRSCQDCALYHVDEQ